MTEEEYPAPPPRATPRPIAALYVLEDGPYSDLPGVDPWPESRDARTYPGPFPAVCHPPCTRWGRFWNGGPSYKGPKLVKGADGGCFAAALATVRRWGGVIEHPEASHAWAHYWLEKPPFHGGWIRADTCGGWTCCVAQGHYGHDAQKMTWIYAVGTDRPPLRWGRARGLARLDEGFHSAEERKAARAAGQKPRRRLSRRANLSTPAPFRDLLISLARSVEPRS